MNCILRHPWRKTFPVVYLFNRLIYMASYGVISQGVTLRGQVVVALGLCPTLALLMGPSPSSHFRSARSCIDLDSPVTSEQAASRWPLHRQTSTGTSPPHSARPKHPTGTWHAPSGPMHQAGPVLSLARERVRPGVTAALPLTLAAACHWPLGPSSGHACWRAQVRLRARQTHIRECLGQQKSVLTQVPN